MPTEGERITALEVELREVRGDVRERVAEEGRTRDRLHKLEGTTGLLVNEMKLARQQASQNARRLALWMQVLTATVAVAAFGLSVVIALTHP